MEQARHKKFCTPSLSGTQRARGAAAPRPAVSFFQVSAPELVSGISGDSEGKVRVFFQSAATHAPSIIFIDEADVVMTKRDGGGGGGGKSMEKRIVAQLLTCMDGLPASSLSTRRT